METGLDMLIKTVLRIMAADCELDDETKKRLYLRIFSGGKAGAGNEQE